MRIVYGSGLQLEIVSEGFKDRDWSYYGERESGACQ